jgi:hypothetical protein
MPSQNYNGFDFAREELAAAMREAYDDIIEFVTTPAFKAIHAELMSLPKVRKTKFRLNRAATAGRTRPKRSVCPKRHSDSNLGLRRSTTDALCCQKVPSCEVSQGVAKREHNFRQ